MIKFFRNIRQNLLNEGKITKYLKYAIGEIVLVVIGILIALQINNWNEGRKEKLLENNLKKNLYNELLNVLEYNKEVLSNEFDFQFQSLKLLLTDTQDSGFEKFITKTKDLWMVKEFSLNGFILSFTIFYDPDFKFYKSAINDGTISIIKDKDFVSDLEFIYINGPSRLEKLYEKELKINEEIQFYISRTYPEIFLEKSSDNATWNLETTLKLLEKIMVDGTYRFLLERKLAVLKSKSLIMEKQIIPRAERTLKLFDEYKQP